MKTENSRALASPDHLTSAPPSTRKAAVARLAHELWRSRGSPAGRDELFWLEAESLTGRAGEAGEEGEDGAKSAVEVAKDAEALRRLVCSSAPVGRRKRGPTSLT